MYSDDYDTCSFVDTADGSDWEYYPSDVYFREDDIIDFGNLGFYLPWGLCTPYRIDDDNDCICRRDDEDVYIHLNHIKVENW